MSGHHNFNELRARMSPERRAANAAAAAELHREYVLAQIRQNVLHLLDLLSGTLRRIVGALGGVLKMQVEIDGRDYPLGFSVANAAIAGV